MGEISPDEFKHFIGDNIRLDPVMLDKQFPLKNYLNFIWVKTRQTDKNLSLITLKLN